MTLHLYLARKFTWYFLAIFASFFALAVVTDAAALFGQFGDKNIGLSDILRLALLRAPSGVYQLLSIITVLASLVLYLSLSRKNELIATRAAGQSAFRSLAAPVLTAFLVGVIAVMALNPMAASSLRKFENETGRYKSGAASAFSLSRTGIWLRQGSKAGQTVIFAKKANFNATRLSGVTFWEFSKSGTALKRVEAAYARLANGGWNLGPGKYWVINRSGQVPDKTARRFKSLKLTSNLTSGQILDGFGNPSTVSIWNMQALIKRLKRSGFSTSKHQVYFQIELAKPLLLAAMVLIGGAFSMRHARAGGIGLAVLLTVLSGLMVYILQNFAQILGSSGAIPVAAAAWGPPVSAILLATGLILHKEDG